MLIKIGKNVFHKSRMFLIGILSQETFQVQ